MGKKVLLLCMFLAGILAGCASGEDPADSASSAVRPEEAVAAEHTPLEADLGRMDYIQLVGDVCCYVRYDKIPDSQRIARYLCRQEGEEPEEVVFVYGEEGTDDYLMCSRVDAEGNWYNLFQRDTLEGTDIFLEKRSGQGEALYCVQAEGFAGILLEERVTDGAAGPQGEFCAVTGRGTILVWDGQGAEQCAIEMSVEEPDGAGLVNAGEAGVYLYHSADVDSIIFQKVDSGQGALGQMLTVELPSPSREEMAQILGSSYGGERIRVYSTYGESCFLSAEDGLWRSSFGGGEPEYLFGWADPYVSLEREQIEQISESDGGLVLLRYDAVLESSVRLRVDWRKQEELAGKTVVTLGCDTYASENLESAARRYNAQSSQYLVEVKTYDLAGSGEKLDEMTLELLQGKGPDLFDFSFSLSISAGYYASKGILEDLTPFLARSGIRLVEPVEEALKIDGGFYTLGESFFLKGLVCQQGYAGGGGLSIQECREMADAYPEAYFKKNTSPALALELLLDADMTSYIDLQEGTCRFDSGEFEALLDMVSSWKDPAGREAGSLYAAPDELRQKKYLVEEVSFMNMVDYLAVSGAVRDFGMVAGYPNSRGEAMYQVCFQNLYGMNSASLNKEGAWDFLEYLVSEENQKRITSFFPITEEGFLAALQKGQGENEASFNLFTMERETGLVPGEQDMEDMWEIVSHVYYPDRQQSVISAIIREEAQAVFDGGKTSRQAAETIQNRVSLFLAE